MILIVSGGWSASVRAQQAVFTPLGKYPSDGAYAGSVKVAGTAAEPVVVATFTDSGLAEWKGEAGWRSLNTRLNTKVDVSPDGSRVLARKDWFSPAVVLRETAAEWPVPAFPETDGYKLYSWDQIGFYGATGMVGKATLHLQTEHTRWEKTAYFRLNLATGAYEMLPERLQSGTVVTEVNTVSPKTGRIMFWSGASNFGKLGFLDLDGAEREEKFDFISPQPAVMSPNGRWLAVKTDSYRAAGVNASSWPQRWDLAGATAVRSDLSQRAEVPGTGAGGVSFAAILDDGTVYGTVTGEVASGKVFGKDACVWHPNGVRVNLREVLLQHYGLDVGGWHLESIQSVSEDGRLLAGSGKNPQGQTQPWLLTLSEALPPATQEPQPDLWVQKRFWNDAGSATALTLAFPKTALNVSKSDTLVLNNTGDAPLAVTALEISGPSAAEFSVPLFTEPRTISVGGSSGLGIVFTPQSSGSKSATLKILTSDPEVPEFIVTLTGEGPSPVLHLSEIYDPWANPRQDGTIRLSSVPGRVVEKTVRIRNNGNQEATNVTAAVTGATVTGLEVATPPPAVLAPNAEAQLTVRFTAGETGSGEAALTLSCDNPATPSVSMPIVTAVTEAVQIQVKDDTGSVQPSGTGLLNFEQITFDSTLDKAVRVENLGDVDFRLSLRIEGTDANQFDINLPLFSYNPKTTYQIWAQSWMEAAVRFKPTSAGMKTARLVIDDPAHLLQPYVVQLTGQSMPGSVPQFVFSPRSEINTTTLTKASFRVLGTVPLSYRVIRSGTPGPWKTATSLNAETLPLVTAGDYSNTFQIELSNYLGTALSPVFVRAKVSLPLPKVTVTAGGATSIVCTVLGNTSDLAFEWLKDGVPVVDDGIVDLADSHHLLFNKARVSDTGRYSCRVRPAVAYDGETALVGETFLDVIGPPEIIPFSLRPARTLEALSFNLRTTHDRELPPTFTVTGLPPGMRHIQGMGIISGTIAASAASKGPRDYTITVRAKNSVGQGQPYQTTWRIEPHDSSLAGTYHGTIERSRSQDLGRHLGGSFLVTVNRAGSFSGRVITGGVSRPFSGTLRGTAPMDLPAVFDPPLPEGMIHGEEVAIGVAAGPIRMLDGELAGLGFGIQGSILGGILEDSYRSIITGFKQGPAPAHLLSGKLGRHHFQLGVEAAEDAPSSEVDVDLPEGKGFAALSLTAAGAVKWTGRLPEGTAITGSSGLSEIEMPGEEAGWVVPMHQTLYSARGSVQGMFVFPDGFPMAMAYLDWNKNRLQPAKPDRLYPEFPVQTLMGEGSLYVTGKNLPLFESAFDFTLQALQPNGRLTMTGNSLTESVTVPFNLSSKGKLTLTATTGPAPGPLNRPKLTVVPATGLFTTTATVTQPSPSRALTGQALWIPHLQQAAGYFLLPEPANPQATPATTVKTSPIRSGLIEIQAPDLPEP